MPDSSRAQQIAEIEDRLQQIPGLVRVTICGDRLRAIFHLAAVPSGPTAPPTAPPMAPSAELSEMEANIIEALGTDTLTGQKIADQAGYPFDAGLRACLAAMRRRGLLGGRPGEQGYFAANP